MLNRELGPALYALLHRMMGHPLFTLLSFFKLLLTAKFFQVTFNRIGGVMVSVLVFSVVFIWFEPRSDLTIKLACIASHLSTQLKGVRTKTGWH